MRFASCLSNTSGRPTITFLIKITKIINKKLILFYLAECQFFFLFFLFEYDFEVDVSILYDYEQYVRRKDLCFYQGFYWVNYYDKNCRFNSSFYNFIQLLAYIYNHNKWIDHYSFYYFIALFYILCDYRFYYY